MRAVVVASAEVDVDTIVRTESLTSEIDVPVSGCAILRAGGACENYFIGDGEHAAKHTSKRRENNRLFTRLMLCKNFAGNGDVELKKNERRKSTSL